MFYRQLRVGKYGKLFVVFKFRTMRVLKHPNEGTFSPGNLSRITFIGRFSEIQK